MAGTVRLMPEKFDSLSMESLRCGSGWRSLRSRDWPLLGMGVVLEEEPFSLFSGLPMAEFGSC